ncbi:MAG: aa3-type cytochrome c oxidase subunit IV [Acetobacteraceae bacterium]|nr:aa3-type cytochrome c oxidase subunit IV [Acetobacteraceae bacterium]
MDEQSTVVTQAVTPDAFLADRQRFWMSFTRFVTYAAIVVAVILVGMRLFLV